MRASCQPPADVLTVSTSDRWLGWDVGRRAWTGRFGWRLGGTGLGCTGRRLHVGPDVPGGLVCAAFGGSDGLVDLVHTGRRGLGQLWLQAVDCLGHHAGRIDVRHGRCRSALRTGGLGVSFRTGDAGEEEPEENPADQCQESPA